MDEVQATQKKKRILVAIPSEGLIPEAAYSTHLEFMFSLGKRQASLPFECSIGTVGGVFTPKAREAICEGALRDKFDYVFMFDDDMLFDMDPKKEGAALGCETLVRLYERNVDVIAPLAFMKRPPHYPVIFSQRKGIQNGKPWFSNNVVLNYPKNSLMECDAVGFGAVLIKTDVIRKMNPPYFMSTCGTGEDILFCLNAKNQAGAHIFCDTSVKIGHLAARTAVIDEEVFEKHNKVDKIREMFGDYSQAKKESCLVA